MAKKQKSRHKATGEKSSEKQKTSGKDREEGCVIETSIETSRTLSGIREFIDRFKSDVEKKRRAFKSFSLRPKSKER